MEAPIKVRRIDFYPDEWLVGVRMLNMDERAIYFHVLALIYSNSGPIIFNPREIARELHSKATKVLSIVSSLVEKEKLELNDGVLSNRRALNEIGKAASRIEQNRSNGPKGGRPRKVPAALMLSTSPDHPEIISRCAPGTATDDQQMCGGTEPHELNSLSGLGKPSGFENQNLTTTSTSTNRKKKENAALAAPVGASLFDNMAAREKPVFDFGKMVLGQSTGGLIRKLMGHFDGNIDRTMDALKLAKTKSSPREYVGAILRGEPAARTDSVLAETNRLYREMGVI